MYFVVKEAFKETTSGSRSLVHVWVSKAMGLLLKTSFIKEGAPNIFNPQLNSEIFSIFFKNSRISVDSL